MMTKLMKYEIKSTYKVFFAIVVSFLLLSILFCVGISSQSNVMMMILTIAYLVVGTTTFFAYLITLFNRYYKNLYGREGYLMFTLPVKGWQIVCSKFLVAMFWNIVLIVAICVCFAIVTTSILLPPDAVITIRNELPGFLRENAVWMIWLFVSVLLGIANMIARIYFVISAAYLPFIKKMNIPIAIALYFIINAIENLIMNFAVQIEFQSQYRAVIPMSGIANTIGNAVISNPMHIPYSTISITIIMIILFLAISSYILEKKASIK